MDKDMENMQEFLMGEVLLCGLLGRALYEDPDRAWLEQLIQEDIFSEVPLGAGQEDVERGRQILDQWAKKYAAGLANEEFDAIQKDKLYLFAGVGRPLAPVWESVYFSKGRLIFQEQTLQVRNWYARFGLEFERLSSEPDDHIGVELSFLAHMATLALNALENEDQASVDELLQNQRDFLSEHLLRWAPAWSELVQKNATTDFYRGLGILTQGALMTIARQLNVEVPKKEVM
jgi:TorA maturation chaperone TorD